MRTKRLSGEARRDAIIGAAIQLFAEKGFRGATTRELARAVGVTEPVLYQHFKTKRELYSAIIEQKAAEGMELSDRRLGRYLAGCDDAGFLTALARLLLERYERDRSFVRLLMFSALEGHELAELFQQRQLHCFYDLVAGYLRRRMAEGAFREMDPYLAARLFLGMINHHGLVRVLFEDRMVRASRKVVIHEMVRTFLEGIRIKAREM